MKNSLFIYRYCNWPVMDEKIRIFNLFCKRMKDFIKTENINSTFIFISDNTPKEHEDFMNDLINKLLPGLNVIFISTKSCGLLQAPFNGKELIKWRFYTYHLTSKEMVRKYANYDTCIFFCEDDYLYKPDAFRKAFHFQIEHKGDFVNIADHPTHYRIPMTEKMYQIFSENMHLEIVYEQNHHWRICDSTCFTHLATLEALEKNKEFLLCPSSDWGDDIMWHSMWRQGKSKLWCSIPGLACHWRGPHHDEEGYWNNMMLNEPL